MPFLFLHFFCLIQGWCWDVFLLLPLSVPFSSSSLAKLTEQLQATQGRWAHSSVWLLSLCACCPCMPCVSVLTLSWTLVYFSVVFYYIPVVPSRGYRGSWGDCRMSVERLGIAIYFHTKENICNLPVVRVAGFIHKCFFCQNKVLFLSKCHKNNIVVNTVFEIVVLNKSIASGVIMCRPCKTIEAVFNTEAWQKF